MEYKIVSGMPEQKILENILQLHHSIFKVKEKSGIESKPNLLFALAIKNGKVAGYKIGYELYKRKFYSWLGGVDPDCRNQGIGSKLMEVQHQYLREHGYRIVQTITKNKWRNMLILNLKHGYDIIGTYTDYLGELKIILEKRLEEDIK
ncbi:GNAT family N-acetyltransferase [Neobacillus terrae]|uniref:GNAT family N-acetyltransferase n=1 Tax=Neobacillus terrae TaxID=3034837 RepID=UPI001407EFB3|nr:GNAT family N-acetyltransferase [Neobacillus terrae]NHM32092.1 GNAT family N-acetyltransferase [Neobacillus terrae]